MTTPQQFLESFFNEKAAASAEANAHLVPVYRKYFGQPLLERARNLLLHDGAEQDLEDVKQSGSSAVVIVREHFRLGDVRRRYHLSAIGESWNIVRIDGECIRCRTLGRNTSCEECGGEGWHDRRAIGAEAG